MDTNHLRYFATIASCGSMSAAAKQLGVSQPTLTSAVRQLEKQVGSTLFLRERSGVTLTKSGEEMRRCAQEIFAMLEDATHRIRGIETQREGSFVIGCHESLGAYFLPAFMTRFLAAEPAIDVSLWNGTSESVLQSVLARKVDFGLVVNPRSYPDLVLSPIYHDAVDLFVSTSEASCPTLEGAHERLRRGPLIFAGRIFQCMDLIGQLTAQHVVPTRLISCGDLELVKSLALGGVGVALLPRRVAAYGQPGGLRRLHDELPFFPDTIHLVYRADLHRTSAAMRLKNALLAHGQRLEQQGDGFGGTPRKDINITE